MTTDEGIRAGSVAIGVVMFVVLYIRATERERREGYTMALDHVEHEARWRQKYGLPFDAKHVVAILREESK